MTLCPLCRKGKLKAILKTEEHHGVNLGTFPAQHCVFCHETWTSGKTMERIEEAAKAKGVWGLGAQTTITKTGNSLAVRIPKKLADFLRVRQGQAVYLHPNRKGLLVIELRR